MRFDKFRTFIDLRLSRTQVIVNTGQNRLLSLLKEVHEQDGEGVRGQRARLLSVDDAQLGP